MKHRSRKRNTFRCALKSQNTVAEQDAYIIRLNASAIASVAALRDYPDHIIPDKAIETAARSALYLRAPHIALSRQYDLATLASVFVAGFRQDYQKLIAGYRSQPDQHAQDMADFGQYDAHDLMNWYIEVNTSAVA